MLFVFHAIFQSILFPPEIFGVAVTLFYHEIYGFHRALSHHRKLLKMILIIILGFIRDTCVTELEAPAVRQRQMKNLRIAFSRTFPSIFNLIAWQQRRD